MTPDTERLAKLIGYEYRPPEGQSGCSEYWAPIEDDGSQPHLEDFDPFSNINDAFMVAEKLRLKLDGFVLCDLFAKEWRASFFADGPEMPEWSRDGKTPAEAISKAALAWLDAQENTHG